ncbi:MAG: hypothetical protein U9O59_03540 [Actinomycetota bacterium]|nr:hypothetical protein [Actinomycetota bacterium]
MGLSSQLLSEIKFEKLINLVGEKSADIESRKYKFDSKKNKNVFTMVITSRGVGFSNSVVDKLSKLKEIEKIKIY